MTTRCRAVCLNRISIELVKRLQKKLDGEPGCITSSSHGHVIIAGEKNHE